MKKCLVAVMHWVRVLGVLAGFLGWTVCLLTAEEPKRVYDLAAGEAAVTLRQFAELSGREILFAAEIVRGIHTRAVRGEYTALETVNRMLAGTNLQAVQDEQSRAIAIRAAPNGQPAPMMRPGDEKLPPDNSIPTQATHPANTDSRPMKKKSKNPLVLLGAFLSLALAPEQTVRAATEPTAVAATGSLTGTVSNDATGNLLEGARIELVGTGISTLTDNTGRYVLPAVPAGSHKVIVHYIGLDAVGATVTVASGQRAVRNFELTTGIYQLAEFKVTGEREGDAAALTAQRNAANVKNVVAMDSFGNVPNMSSGEVAIRLPGIAGVLDDEGNVTDLSVRGMGAGLNSVTIDGGSAANQSAAGRQFRMQHFPGAMFEQIEVTKGHTPDKVASSLGGTVNFKTRSPLSMKEKRRINYRLGVRMAPSFTEQHPFREKSRSHPSFNLAYQEAFGIFGQDRNLGIAVNLFHNENAAGFFQTIRNFQNTTDSPAYLWDYRTRDRKNNRKQTSLNAKIEYRFSENAKVTVNLVDNTGYEPAVRIYDVRAFTNQSVGTTGNAGILPGYTDRITQVRAVPASMIDVSSEKIEWFTRLRHVDATVEHRLGGWELDYGAVYSYVNTNSAHGGNLINRISNIGWILDRSGSDLYPRFLQTEGADFTNPENYRPQPLAFEDSQTYFTTETLRANARYVLPTRTLHSVKAGILRDRNTYETARARRRYTYVGGAALPSDPSLTDTSWDFIKTGRVIPQWEIDDFAHDNRPIHSSLWREDIYYGAADVYIGNRLVVETNTAAYLMAQGKLGSSRLGERTGYLTGVRVENTQTRGAGYVIAANPSTTAERAADGVAAAWKDYANNRRERSGKYTKSFPSVHLVHDVTSNLKARLSWSTSFGRPHMNHSLPVETASQANATLTINNPGIVPQEAASWDAALEYYFEPVGNFSLGWFHKTINNYIVNGVEIGTVSTGLDNGYNGNYGGYRILTSVNAGTATVRGWEISYRQQLTALPGLLKGLSFWGNFTRIETEGDFGGSVVRRTGEVAGFIPKTGNVGLSWRYRGFSSSVSANYTSEYITSYTANALGSNLYREERTIVNFGASYQIRPWISVTCDVANVFNEPQVLYRGLPSRMSTYNIPGVNVSLGVSGRF